MSDTEATREVKASLKTTLGKSNEQQVFKQPKTENYILKGHSRYLATL